MMDAKEELEKQLFEDSDQELDANSEDNESQDDERTRRRSKRSKTGMRRKRKGEDPIEKDKQRENEDEFSPAHIAKLDFERAVQMAMPSRRRKMDLDYTIVITT